MKLTLHERYALRNILPTEGSYTLMTRVGKLFEALATTEKEKEDFGVKEIVDAAGEPTGALRWNPAHYKTEREIDIGQHMFDIIVKILKKLDDGEKLGPGHVSLFRKFVELPAEEARAAAKVEASIDEEPDEMGEAKPT